MHTANVFISHSFAPEYFENDLEKFRSFIRFAISQSLEEAGSDAVEAILPNLFFDSRSYGEGLNETILAELRKCNIFIADITGARPNVLYELGFAQASGADLILIQNHGLEVQYRKNLKTAADLLDKANIHAETNIIRSLTESPMIPSDLQGIIIGSYNSLEEVTNLLLERLTSIFSVFSRQIHTGTVVHIPRCFWFDYNVEEITVVCAPEDDDEKGPYANESSDNYIFVDNLEDRDAVLEVNKFLSRSFPDAEVYTRGSIVRGLSLSKTNIVIVGGPLNNEMARQFMERLNIGLDYKIPQDCPVVELQSQTGEAFEIAVARDHLNLLTQDVGYFGWFQNPLKTSCNLVLCQGFQTWGTLAATRLFSDESNGRKNRSLLHRRMNQQGIGNLAQLNFVEAFFSVPVMEDRQTDVPDLAIGGSYLGIG